MQLRGYAIPFTAAFLVFGAVFLGIDYAIMGMQGLTLFFQP